MVMATKAGLSGLWRIDRHIKDGRGPDGVFTGEGRFLPQGDTLAWHETGTLTIGTTSLVASRCYLWRFPAPDRIEVLFDDGRAFHSFDPGAPVATHDCPPDSYRVTYDFSGPSHWVSEWRVTGPRKTYVVRSRMSR